MIKLASTCIFALCIAGTHTVHADQTSAQTTSAKGTHKSKRTKKNRRQAAPAPKDIDALLDDAAPVKRTQQRKDPRCPVFFDQAITHMATQQYPMMLKLARQSERACPGPHSQFLLGMALANMFNTQLADDPAELEQLRVRGLLALRRAAAGGTELPGAYRVNMHEWIVFLQDQGPAVVDDAEPTIDPATAWVQTETPTTIPFKTPPPQPMASAPWGPAITGAAGIVALGVALGTGLSADSRFSEADAATNKLLAGGTVDPNVIIQIRQLEDEGNTLQSWTTGLLVGGGAALATATLWYFLLSPSGGWQWATVGPTGVHLRARF